MAKPQHQKQQQQTAGVKRTAPTGPPPSATVFRKSAKRARADGGQAIAKAAAPAPSAKVANNGKPKAAPSSSSKANGAPRKAHGKAPKAQATSRPSPASSKPAPSSSGPTSATPSVPLTIRQPAPAQSTFRILAGSYERLLFGLLATPHFAGPGGGASSKLEGVEFETMFLFPAHPSSVTSVAAAGWDSKWLATGAADEQVKVWDLNKRKEVGALVGCQGTITTLSFPIRTYLLTSDSSGLINIYRTRDWALLRTMRGHTGAVNCVAAHPSGRLALSVGKDGMLRMWDLMRGKGAGAIRIEWGGHDEEEEEEEAEQGTDEDTEKPKRRVRASRSNIREEPVLVRWDSTGTRFVIMGRTYVQVYATDMTRLHVWSSPANAPRKRPIDVGFFAPPEGEGEGEEEGKATTTEMLHIGTEEGVVRLLSLPSVKAARKGKEDMEEVARLVGHKNRVKATSFQSLLSPSGDKVPLAVTASSDGFLRVFDLSPIILSGRLGSESKQVSVSEQDGVSEVGPLAEFDTEGARITCLSVVGGDGSRRAAGKQASQAASTAGEGTDKGKAKAKEVKIAAVEPDLQGDDDDKEEREGEDDLEQDPMLDSDADEDDEDDEAAGDEDLDSEDEDEELNRLEAMIQLAKEKGVDIEALLGGEEGESDEDDEDDFSGADEDEDEDEEEGEEA